MFPLPMPTEVGSFVVPDFVHATHYFTQYILSFAVFVVGVLGFILYGYESNSANEELKKARQDLSIAVIPSEQEMATNTINDALTKINVAKDEVKSALMVSLIGPFVFWFFGVWIFSFLIVMLVINIGRGFYYGVVALNTPDVVIENPVDTSLNSKDSDI